MAEQKHAAEKLIEDLFAPQNQPASTGLPQAPQAHEAETLIERMLSPEAQGALGINELPPKNEGEWGIGKNALDALLLGGGVRAQAAIEALAGGGKGLRPTGVKQPAATDSFMDRYSAAKERLESARDTYGRTDPSGALLSSIIPSTATTTAGMLLGQEYLAAPAAAKLLQAAPWLESAVNFVGGNAGKWSLNPMKLAPKVASTATQGAIQGAEGAAMQAGLGTEPFMDQVKTGTKVGAFVGPVGNLLGAGVRSNINPTTAESAERMLQLAPDAAPRPGQLPGAPRVAQTLDQVFSRGENSAQREAIYEATTAKAGLPTKNPNQAWVAEADKLNGGEMSRIARQYSIDGHEPQLTGDLNAVETEALTHLSNENYKKFKEIYDKVNKNLISGTVPGSVYQGWTQTKGLLSMAAKDPNLRPYITGPNSLKEVIDHAWERSIQNSGTPTAAEDFAKWTQARSQYKVTRTLDSLIDETNGGFDPRKLTKAVQSRYGTALRAGEFGDLAKGGEYLTPPPKSWSQTFGQITPGKAAVGGVGAVGLGGLLGHFGPEVGPALSAIAHNPVESTGALAGAAALGLVGKGVNSVTSSDWYLRSLLNHAQNKGPPAMRGINPLIPLAEDFVNRRN